MEGVCAVITALMKRPENYFQLLRVIGSLNSGYSSECFFFFQNVPIRNLLNATCYLNLHGQDERCATI